ncbi:hypothetical protein SAMN05444377_10756 [Flavobacterium fontis]|uniref:Peptidase E n=1 Tax=Flavobacterium fontis TaxID=1124188 RepID=A0A1M5B050_9FLAO|nr:DUF6702 family protein [Flavobacterium fontis]SHF35552.1 hypothetical protein SAMN05444377_10756 [Flavobacterium fontis]
MSKRLLMGCLGLWLLTSGFSAHKFYVAIFQVDHNASKKRMEITARVFADDLNSALDKKYKTRHHLATDQETEADIADMKKYFAAHLRLTIGGQPKTLQFKSKALDGNVYVCYFSIPDVSKATPMEVENTVFTELFEDQQNMMHFQYNGTKQTLVLTGENSKGMLK